MEVADKKVKDYTTTIVNSVGDAKVSLSDYIYLTINIQHNLFEDILFRFLCIYPFIRC